MYFIALGHSDYVNLKNVFNTLLKSLNYGSKLERLYWRQVYIIAGAAISKIILIYIEYATYPTDLNNVLLILTWYVSIFMVSAMDFLLGALAELTRIVLEEINSKIKVKV